MSEYSCYTKSETGGEGSSGKPTKPSDLDSAIDLNQSSSGELDRKHDEKENKRSEEVGDIEFGQDDSTQSSGNDENMGNTECPAGCECRNCEDQFKFAAEDYLEEIGARWIYFDMRNDTFNVCFIRLPDNVEDLKRDLRALMRGRERPIEFAEASPPSPSV